MTNNMDFTTLIQNRYSCRAFDPREVEQEIVDRILEAGRIAPTAVNRQPVHVWAVTDAATLAAIQGVTRSNYGAPVLLVVGCRPADAWVRRYDGKNGAEVDASIVATYLMLAAENEGLATLWVGSFDPMGLAALLPGTDGYDLVAMINVGYPAPTSAPSPHHKPWAALQNLSKKFCRFHESCYLCIVSKGEPLEKGHKLT